VRWAYSERAFTLEDRAALLVDLERELWHAFGALREQGREEALELGLDGKHRALK